MKRSPVKNVLVLGSGPIIIGQACEFDYSGTQACRALREEGVRVVLLNSNPATIMTDPEMADRTYIEPLDPTTVIEILRKEGCDAILPTMGGQTGINLVLALSKIPHALDGIEIIGANLKAIHLAEDRKAFGEVVESIGLSTPRSVIIRSQKECEDFANEIGYPFILRPSFTLGGTGQSFVYSAEELKDKVYTALQESPIAEALVEESVLGWKEYELEVMRDAQDNAIVVCSIENVDAMGVHTGDSITVAPQQTLTDREYQIMRTEALKVVRRVGVETGGCNVQFAVNPEDGRRIIIEMNPRVSRSSALASKVTGYPIAYVATKLALGYYLPEIKNVITQTTQACFEPTIDYVAVKIPRWHFEKFQGAKDELLPQMQSVGEVLALGGSFGEAFHKGLNSLEKDWPKFPDTVEEWKSHSHEIKNKHSLRGWAVWDAIASGVSIDDLAEWSEWDPWFLNNIKRYQKSQKLGYKANFLPEAQPRFEMIDTCSAETAAKTPYFYTTREELGGEVSKNVCKLPHDKKGRVVILGSGPNRIGQGVEFDYCCVHASFALRRLGYETIMVNCNPETVSTDPTTSDRLYLEPIMPNSVKSILQAELDPVMGEGKPAFVLLQMGGQTPLKLAEMVEKWGYKTLGTSTESIDLCEDRSKFAELLSGLGIRYPEFQVSRSLDETIESSKKIGFPVLVRPSFVLGGRAMRICAHVEDIHLAYEEAQKVSEDHPLYIDKFLAEAVEFDIDGICNGDKAWVAGVMEHVEEAGVHSGDSSCVIPPFRLPASKIEKMAKIAKDIAVNSGARGFFNIQMAVEGENIFVIEANPRASRTVPFLAKATGYPLVEWALRAALGEKIEDIVSEGKVPGDYRLPGHGYAVKSPVFPFNKFKDVDPVLTPEMKSTGEVMGTDRTAGGAFAKALLASGHQLPVKGSVLFSVRDEDKTKALHVARVFDLLGFQVLGTPGTADYLTRAGITCLSVAKIGRHKDGEMDLLDHIKSGQIDMVINTTASLNSIKDGMSIRKAANIYKIPIMTTISGAEIASMAIQVLKETGIRPQAIQDFI